MLFWKTSRERQLEVQRFLARLTNQGALSKMRRSADRRAEQRTAYHVAVWVIPVDGDVPQIAQAFIALTRDLSSKGLSVITNYPVAASEVLVCISGDFQMQFLRANILSRKNLGLGWVQCCMEVSALVDEKEYPQLREFVDAVVA